MMFKIKAFLCCTLLLSAAASAQSLPEPDNVFVHLMGDELRDARSRLAGRGIMLELHPRRTNVHELIAQAALPDLTVSYCGKAARIAWHEVNRAIDPEGGTHVVYRQHLVGEGVNAELVGSEVAAHFQPDGRLLIISGRQFESVKVSGCPAVSAAKAVESARERVLLYKHQYGRFDESWAMDASRTRSLAQTSLKLVQIDGVFRPAYFTTGEDASGESHWVVLDAESERLVGIGESNPGGNCTPNDPMKFVGANGQPVRDDVPYWRAMKANVASRAGGYTHEGVWIPGGSVPIRHLVYHGVEVSNLNFRCSSSANYTLFPLTDPNREDPNCCLTEPGCCWPVYVDAPAVPGVTQFKGRAAGDALWHTYRTMLAFKGLGRNGWDGGYGDARIVVNSGQADQARFLRDSSPLGPSNSVSIGRKYFMYSGAASLDLVAHEWGHGVIFESSRIDRTTPYGEQLHEGFADVIGMIVEKRAQVGGTGVEQSSDWVMHEDMTYKPGTSGYARGALDDGDTGHPWTGPDGTYSGLNDRLHRLDGADDPNSPHATGNLLNVVHSLIAARGTDNPRTGLNPICKRMGHLPGCNPATDVISSSEAWGDRKAGELLFYAIQFTIRANTKWEDVADLVNDAVVAKYSRCQFATPYSATLEQTVVRKAFAGIGYPRRASDFKCTP